MANLAQYQIHGLRVVSEIPLDASPASAGENGNGDVVHVRWGGSRSIPFEPPEGRPLGHLRVGGFGFWAAESAADPQIWLLRYGGLCDATFDRETRSITVYPEPAADRALISLVVSGSVLTHVVTADGGLVLHGSAVAFGQDATAVVGPSGAGKSTLAALLCIAGGTVLADDALRCEVYGDVAICHPGSPVLRLRSGAAALSEQIPGKAAVGHSPDGRVTVRPESGGGGPRRLQAVLIPSFTREGVPVTAQRLEPAEALMELVSHPRLIGWTDAQIIGGLFGITADVAERVPLHRVTLPAALGDPKGLAAEIVASLDR